MINRKLNQTITIEYPSGLTEEATLLGFEDGKAIVLESEGQSAQDVKEYGNNGTDKTACAGFWYRIGRTNYWFEFLGQYSPLNLAARWDALFCSILAEEIKQGCPHDQLPDITRVWPLDIGEYSPPGRVFVMEDAPCRKFYFRVIDDEEKASCAFLPWVNLVEIQDSCLVDWYRGEDCSSNLFHILEA